MRTWIFGEHDAVVDWRESVDIYKRAFKRKSRDASKRDPAETWLEVRTRLHSNDGSMAQRARLRRRGTPGLKLLIRVP